MPRLFLHIFSSAESCFRFFIWLTLLLIVAIDAYLMMSTFTYQIDPNGVRALAGIIIFGEAFSLLCRYRLRFYMLAVLTETIVLCLTTHFFTTLLQFMVGASPYPYHDEFLIGLDRAMGFDWLAYVHWLNERPALSSVFLRVYDSWTAQSELAILILILQNSYTKIYTLLLATLVCCLVCVSVFYLFPSVGIITYLPVNPANYSHVRMEAGYMHIDDLTQLRNHTMQTIVFPLNGLINFPSFHSCLAVMLAWTY